MYGTFFASGFVFPKTASVETAVGIVQQFPATWTQFGMSFMLTAKQVYHLLYHHLLFLYASILHRYKYNSFSFLVAHTFFRPCVARKFITAPIPLAPLGHTDTHLMQDIHLAESTVLGSESGMASAGHCLAQTPQRLHPRLPLGWGTLPPFL